MLPVMLTLRRASLRIALASVLAATAGTASLRPASAQSTPSGPTDPQEIEAFFDGVMAVGMEAEHVPGSVVVLVRDGEVLFAKGYGYADLETRTPVDPARTLFRPGSISKLFTWTAVMQLVERGQVSLDTDVNEYLDFEIPSTFAEPITLRHLMTHTPGFEDRGEGLFALDPDRMLSLEAAVRDGLPARVFPPGEIGAYSNYGTALAGYIVTRVSGQSFDDYIEANVLTPLGMTHATFRQPLPEPIAGDMSRAYNFTEGHQVEGGFEYIADTPAGALSAAGLDLGRFMIAHLQNGRYGDARILSEATAQRMHSQLYTADPRITGMAHGFFESEENGQRVLSHGGDTILFHSGLWLLPEHSLGLYVSTNGTAGGQVVADTYRAFMDRYFPPPATSDPASPSDTARLTPYAGEYYLARSNATTFEKLLVLLSPVNVSAAQDGDWVVNVSGESMRMVEVEPGLLQSRDDPDQRFVVRQVADQTQIHMSPPLTLIKTPWYATSALHLVLLLGGGLLLIATLIGWTISFFSGLAKREPRRWGERLARLTAAGFAVGFLVFVIGMAAIFLDIQPAYGVPGIFFGLVPGWFPMLLMLPLGLMALGVAMAIWTGLAWWRGYWGVTNRLYYTALTALALAQLGSLYFWNLLL